MPDYRSWIVAAFASLLVVTPAAAQEPSADPATRAAEEAAQQAQSAANRSLPRVDFAGSWARHGIGVEFGPDGVGTAAFRVYRWCKAAKPGEPCDDPNGFITAGGRARLAIERVEGRTAYGTISESNDQKRIPNGPFSLTEYDHGIGLLMPGAGAPPATPFSPRDGITLCGPRYDDPPDEIAQQYPCGA